MDPKLVAIMAKRKQQSGEDSGSSLPREGPSAMISDLAKNKSATTMSDSTDLKDGDIVNHNGHFATNKCFTIRDLKEVVGFRVVTTDQTQRKKREVQSVTTMNDEDSTDLKDTGIVSQPVHFAQQAGGENTPKFSMSKKKDMLHKSHHVSSRPDNILNILYDLISTVYDYFFACGLHIYVRAHHFSFDLTHVTTFRFQGSFNILDHDKSAEEAEQARLQEWPRDALDGFALFLSIFALYILYILMIHTVCLR